MLTEGFIVAELNYKYIDLFSIEICKVKIK